MALPPASLGFAFTKNFHTCPRCGMTNKDKNNPEHFSISFFPVTLQVFAICKKCEHHWEVK